MNVSLRWRVGPCYTCSVSNSPKQIAFCSLAEKHMAFVCLHICTITCAAMCTGSDDVTMASSKQNG